MITMAILSTARVGLRWRYQSERASHDPNHKGSNLNYDLDSDLD